MAVTPIFYVLFLAAFYSRSSSLTQALSLFLVVMWLAMELSDILDGYIARKHNLVSDLGKIMDPFSDVISRITYFFLFVQVGFLPAWPLIIIFWRELSIVFIRAVLNKAGITLAANKGGKTKAFFYFAVSLIGMFMLLNAAFFFLPTTAYLTLRLTIAPLFFILAAAASVLSFIVYFIGFIKTDYIQKIIKE